MTREKNKKNKFQKRFKIKRIISHTHTNDFKNHKRREKELHKKQKDKKKMSRQIDWKNQNLFRYIKTKE